MLPLKHKKIWKKQLEDSEKNTLTVRIEKEQVLVDDGETTFTYTLEIRSPAEDRRGQPIKKRLRIDVDEVVMRDLREAISALANLQDSSPPQEIFVEIRCECSGKLVITRESPPFKNVSEAQIRYVIGNGRDLRFVFDEFDDLDRLRWDLANVQL